MGKMTREQVIAMGPGYERRYLQAEAAYDMCLDYYSQSILPDGTNHIGPDIYTGHFSVRPSYGNAEYVQRLYEEKMKMHERFSEGIADAVASGRPIRLPQEFLDLPVPLNNTEIHYSEEGCVINDDKFAELMDCIDRIKENPLPVYGQQARGLSGGLATSFDLSEYRYDEDVTPFSMSAVFPTDDAEHGNFAYSISPADVDTYTACYRNNRLNFRNLPELSSKDRLNAKDIVTSRYGRYAKCHNPYSWHSKMAGFPDLDNVAYGDFVIDKVVSAMEDYVKDHDFENHEDHITQTIVPDYLEETVHYTPESLDCIEVLNAAGNCLRNEIGHDTAFIVDLGLQCKGYGVYDSGMNSFTKYLAEHDIDNDILQRDFAGRGQVQKTLELPRNRRTDGMGTDPHVSVSSVQKCLQMADDISQTRDSYDAGLSY